MSAISIGLHRTKPKDMNLVHYSVTLAVLVSLTLTLEMTHAAESSAQRNVLMLIADDLNRWLDTGFYFNRKIENPG